MLLVLLPVVLVAPLVLVVLVVVLERTASGAVLEGSGRCGLGSVTFLGGTHRPESFVRPGPFP
ncbi:MULTISPECIES: hypothetical protein [unclassified Streptomyces]|uniref:hypothetical protein n=1 Tax=unclassified Streptomyces TaxID=2593676 RepID=UPI00131E273E|nr:hypothetical protein [Streptomyces sp. CB01635]